MKKTVAVWQCDTASCGNKVEMRESVAPTEPCVLCGGYVWNKIAVKTLEEDK